MVSRNIASLEVASSFFEIGGDPVEANRLIVNLYNAGRDNQERFDTSTVEDLISTGRLGLISDVEVREAIQLAYKALGEVELALAPARSEYLEGIRAWIPWRLISRIRDECPSMSAVEWACPEIIFNDPAISDIVRRFETDEATIAARLREQGLDQARGMIEMTAAEVDHALDVLAN